MKSLVKLTASFFYLGYSPVASGTIASFAALGLYYIFRNNFYLLTLLLIVVSSLGFLVCARAEEIFKQKDSHKIVIDEVAGLLLAFWGLRLDFTLMLIGFFIFRALDMVKPFPADKLERIAGSPGVMGDDLVAAAYTNIALQIATRILLLI